MLRLRNYSILRSWEKPKMSVETISDVSEAVLTSMTEAEFANWQRQEGIRVIQHRGRYWKETVFGFWEPLHWIARLSESEATSPTPFAWGFRAALQDSNAAAANGSVPVHLLTDLENYASKCLSSNRRHHLRQCQKKVKIFQLTEPTLLQEQGYEVIISAAQRTGYITVPPKEEYLASLKNYVHPKRLILVGLVGGKLGGYITGYAISGTAYFESLYIATEAITTNINLGLVFEFIQACHRSGTIRELVNGLHTPEDKSLCTFKAGIGFPVKYIPAKVKINPIAKQLIHWRYPDKYYRLTGEARSVTENTSET